MLTEKYQPQRLDKKLSKYTKHRYLVRKIEYYDDEAIKYLKSELEETVAERVKLNHRKRK